MDFVEALEGAQVPALATIDKLVIGRMIRQASGGKGRQPDLQNHLFF
jgi:hypothetical protein